MNIIGAACNVNYINEPLAKMWVKLMKAGEAATVSGDRVKTCDLFKKDMKWRQWIESVCTFIPRLDKQVSL
jgi:hypothetical protein